MLSLRTRWLLGGVSVLLPAIVFVFTWALVVLVPGMRFPGALVYLQFGSALVISAWVVETTPVAAPRRRLLLAGAWLAIGVQFVLFMLLALRFSRLVSTQ